MKLFFLTLFSLLAVTFASPLRAAAIGSREVKLVERETSLNSFLAAILKFVPKLNGPINDVAGIMTYFENVMAAVTGVQDTYNELGQPCTEYTIIFARGTTETGNVGVLVGPPLFIALQSLVGTSALTIQGVNNYSASVGDYFAGGDPVGSQEMANEIQQAYAQCPSTKLVASGYSQGGQIVHNAAALLPANVASWISSVVIFGDPDSSEPVTGVAASKTDIICHAGDDICSDGDIIGVAHLTYAENAASAAAFIVSQ